MSSFSKKPSLAIFDLGNVVFRIDWNKMANSWSNSSGIDAEVLKERFTYDEYFSAFERGDISGVKFAECLNASLGMNITYEQFREGWIAIYSAVIPEVENILKKLQGKIRLVAFTNTNSVHNEVWPELYCDVLKNFEHVFVSSEIGFRKPDPKGFLHVLEACDVKPSDALFFDDLSENVDGGRAVGISSHLVDSDLVVGSVFKEFGYL